MESTSVEQDPPRVVERRVMVNLDRCIECGSCAAACYHSHANMPAVGFARTSPALLPVICRQCKSASCVETCPADAMVRDAAGVVRRRLFRCVGCGSCARACPFGVLPGSLSGTPPGYGSPERLSGHQVAKCDLCADRLAAGDGSEPRCVSACPAGALHFADERVCEHEGLSLLGGRTTGESPYKRR